MPINIKIFFFFLSKTLFTAVFTCYFQLCYKIYIYINILASEEVGSPHLDSFICHQGETVSSGETTRNDQNVIVYRLYSLFLIPYITQHIISWCNYGCIGGETVCLGGSQQKCDLIHKLKSVQSDVWFNTSKTQTLPFYHEPAADPSSKSDFQKLVKTLDGKYPQATSGAVF